MASVETEKGVTVADVLDVLGGAVLELDSFKNKWNNPLNLDPLEDDLREVEAEERCPNSRRYARFLVEGKDGRTKIQFVYLRCKQWSCPYCARVNAQVLYVKVKRGVEGCLEAERRDGFRDDYSVKFLTLTLPGREWRAETAREDAESIIKHSFKKVISQLRRKLGHIEYVWVMEFQRDGFAHLHVVLVGQAIAPPEVKGLIEKLWREQQGMGFIKFNTVKGGARGIASYVSKYITKELATGVKGSHVYAASSGFHRASKRGRPQITLIEIGRFTVEEGKYHFTPLWEMHDYVSLETSRELIKVEIEESDDLWCQMLLPFA